MAVNFSQATSRFVSFRWLGPALVFGLSLVVSSFGQDPTPTPKTNDDNDKGTLTVNTDLVTLTLTVTDQFGRYVSGLNKSAFTVKDNNEEQELTYFSDVSFDNVSIESL